MSATKVVSVIIPNLHSPVIDRTLASLKTQTYDLSQVEVLVVGQDKYRFVVENEWLRFIPTASPVIQAVARNIGVKQARGNILVFLDADCIAEPAWLETIMACFADPDIHLVGGGVIFPTADYWTLCDNIAILYEWSANGDRGTRPYLASLNMAVRRAAWRQIGGFDETLAKAEDTEFSIRAHLAGYTLYFEPQAAIIHQPAPARNQVKQVLRRAFESGYWTLKVFRRYQNEIALPRFYRQIWLMVLLAPFTTAGITLKIFRKRALRRFWYTLPVVYLNKFFWRVGGAYQLWRHNQAGR